MRIRFCARSAAGPGRLLGAAAILLLATAAVRADVFLLAGGGRVEGRLLNPTQNPRTSYEVLTGLGGRVSLDSEQVREVRAKSVMEARYEQFLPSVPDTVEGHWNMAERCEQAGLKPQRTFHLERVLKLDPDHAEARHALGYSRVNDRWVRTDEFMTSRGYTRQGGTWRLAQELEMIRQEEDREKEVIEWRRKTKMWRTWILKDRSRAEALANLQAIDSKRAAPALVTLAQDEEELPALRLMYIEILGKLKSNVAVNLFIDLALHDKDPAIRDKCLDQLRLYGAEAAARAFIKALEDKENEIVNRAGVGLGRLKFEDATLPLIDALVTRHRRTIPGRGGNLGATFGNNGIQSFSAGGGGPKVVEFPVENSGVLGALTAMHDANFVYDKERWRNWYITEKTPSSISLRRPID